MSIAFDRLRKEFLFSTVQNGQMSNDYAKRIGKLTRTKNRHKTVDDSKMPPFRGKSAGVVEDVTDDTVAVEDEPEAKKRRRVRKPSDHPAEPELEPAEPLPVEPEEPELEPAEPLPVEPELVEPPMPPDPETGDDSDPDDENGEDVATSVPSVAPPVDQPAPTFAFIMRNR